MADGPLSILQSSAPNSDSRGSVSEALILGLLGAAPTPEEIAAARAKKEGALSAYNVASTASPRPENYSPFQEMVNTYLQGMVPGWNQYGIGKAIAAPYVRDIAEAAQLHKENITRTSTELKDAQEEDRNITARQRASIAAGASLGKSALVGQGSNYKVVSGRDPVTGEPGHWMVSNKNPSDRMFLPASESKQMDVIFQQQLRIASDPTRGIADPNAVAWDNTVEYFKNRNPIRTDPRPPGVTPQPEPFETDSAPTLAPTSAIPLVPPNTIAQTGPGDLEGQLPSRVPDSGPGGSYTRPDGGFNLANVPAGMERVIDAMLKRAESSGNPELIQNTLNKIRQMASGEPAPSAAATATAPNSKVADFKPIAPRNFQGNAQREGAGKAWGAWSVKEHTGLNDVAGRSMALDGQLTAIENLIKNPDVPSGQGAEPLNTVRSVLMTLGFPIDKNAISATDMLLATSKHLALIGRTAEGVNLLPGAMSNYEDKLLQQMVPGAMQSKEGALAMVEMIRAGNVSKRRFADEANKRIEANGGVLPNNWLTIKTSIGKEEMIMMRQEANRITKKFNLPPLE